jgi:hypothetical protein
MEVGTAAAEANASEGGADTAAAAAVAAVAADPPPAAAAGDGTLNVGQVGGGGWRG